MLVLIHTIFFFFQFFFFSSFFFFFDNRSLVFGRVCDWVLVGHVIGAGDPRRCKGGCCCYPGPLHWGGSRNIPAITFGLVLGHLIPNYSFFPLFFVFFFCS
jgi:hypothetical protein